VSCCEIYKGGGGLDQDAFEEREQMRRSEGESTQHGGPVDGVDRKRKARWRGGGRGELNLTRGGRMRI